MLKTAYEEAKRLLSENRDALDAIAEFLIEKETITGKEFMEIFRKVKGIPEPSASQENSESRENRIAMKPVKSDRAEEGTEKPTEADPAEESTEKLTDI